MHVISSSDGRSLHFPIKELHRKYEEDKFRLQMKYYALIRAKHGVWASNQDKFVKSRDQFNELDGTVMEDLFEHYEICNQ